MNRSLMNACTRFADIMKHTDGVLGAWNFGSVMRGMSDEYSDADIVFLIDGQHFRQTEEKLEAMLSGICDDVILCFKESFNCDAVINNGYLLKKEGQIFQFDVFLLNRDRIDDFMCKIHYTDLSEKDIIFDIDGNVKALCESCPRGQLWNDSVAGLAETYRYHLYMSAKYLIRNDYFKLNSVMHTLFEAHASLLLIGYDAIKWGGAENKLGFIPSEKQRHLKKYFCTEDFRLDKDNIKEASEWFEADLKEICGKKNIACDFEAGNDVMRYWKRLAENI